MNKNETIADIRKEAEARFRELLGKHMDSLGHIQAMQQFNQVFDRIEAAAKREDKKAAVGELPHPTAGSGMSPSVHETVEVYHNPSNAVNGAKMREALVKIREIVTADAPADEVEIANIAYLALSAPPRNCDVYPSVAEARNAFICEQCEHPCGDCTVCDDDYALCRPCGIKWLFAPATEQKGAADGSK